MAHTMPEYVIRLLWDEMAAVWIATSDDVPGLVLESGSLDALIERVRFAVPDLLAANGEATQEFSMSFQSERRERICL